MSAPWHLTAAELDAAYDALAARLTEAERQMSDARVLIAVGDYSSAAARLAPKAADSATPICPHPGVAVVEVDCKLICTCCGAAVRRVGHHDRADTFVTADSANEVQS